MRTIIAWSLLAVLALAACEGGQTATPSPAASQTAVSGDLTVDGERTTIVDAAQRRGPWRLVTLGDAYTAGYATELPRRDSWPQQLVESLKRAELQTRLTNLAVRGHDSWQVLDEQLGLVAHYEPDVVTVQVGINDLLYGEGEASYRQNLGDILDGLLELLPPERIFAITTPGDALDPGVVDPEQAHIAIEAVNVALSDVAAERGIEVIDIGPVNRLGEQDASLRVEESIYLYPTAKQYSGWAEIIGPHVHAALDAIEP